ncbi:MAG: hypothetical protein Fues2KO_46710 [Fuerstiella sp.]
MVQVRRPFRRIQYTREDSNGAEKQRENDLEESECAPECAELIAPDLMPLVSQLAKLPPQAQASVSALLKNALDALNEKEN